MVLAGAIVAGAAGAGLRLEAGFGIVMAIAVGLGVFAGLVALHLIVRRLQEIRILRADVALLESGLVEAGLGTGDIAGMRVRLERLEKEIALARATGSKMGGWSGGERARGAKVSAAAAAQPEARSGRPDLAGPDLAGPDLAGPDLAGLDRAGSRLAGSGPDGGRGSVVDNLIRQLAEELAAGPPGDDVARAGGGEVGGLDHATLAAAVGKYRPGAGPVLAVSKAGSIGASRGGTSRDGSGGGGTGRDAAGGGALVEMIRHAVATGGVEVYLQPIFGLPDRKVRYFEAFPRLIDAAGAPVAPVDYAGPARQAGLLVRIDILAFGRTLQILDSLALRGQPRDMFYEVSAGALTDGAFVEGLGMFARRNEALVGHLVLEISQGLLGAGSGRLRETLAGLAAVGFRFALTGAEDYAMDFAALGRQGFAFVKVAADRLPDILRGAPADVSAGLGALRMRVEASGMALIVERIEDDRSLAMVLEHGPGLGQGGLLSEPRPVRQDVLSEGQGEKAA